MAIRQLLFSSLGVVEECPFVLLVYHLPGAPDAISQRLSRMNAGFFSGAILVPALRVQVDQ